MPTDEAALAAALADLRQAHERYAADFQRWLDDNERRDADFKRRFAEIDRRLKALEERAEARRKLPVASQAISAFQRRPRPSDPIADQARQQAHALFAQLFDMPIDEAREVFALLLQFAEEAGLLTSGR